MPTMRVGGSRLCRAFRSCSGCSRAEMKHAGTVVRDHTTLPYTHRSFQFAFTWISRKTR